MYNYKTHEMRINFTEPTPFFQFLEFKNAFLLSVSCFNLEIVYFTELSRIREFSFLGTYVIKFQKCKIMFFPLKRLFNWEEGFCGKQGTKNQCFLVLRCNQFYIWKKIMFKFWGFYFSFDIIYRWALKLQSLWKLQIRALFGDFFLSY